MSEDRICTRILRVAELREQTVRDRLGSLLHVANPEMTLKDSGEYIDIQLCARAANREEAEAMIEQTEERVRVRLAEYIVGTGDTTLQKIIGDLLDQKQWTLSTMESLTGGLIASALTDEHASSAHFFGGIVSYSTPLKEKIGVPHEVVERYGVISEETAKAMARAVRTFLDTELGLGITGVAGPDKQEDQPVGTVYIAVDGPDGMMTAMGSECCAGSDREENKQAATISALNLLRRYLEREGDANRQPS